MSAGSTRENKRETCANHCGFPTVGLKPALSSSQCFPKSPPRFGSRSQEGKAGVSLRDTNRCSGWWQVRPRVPCPKQGRSEAQGTRHPGANASGEQAEVLLRSPAPQGQLRVLLPARPLLRGLTGQHGPWDCGGGARLRLSGHHGPAPPTTVGASKQQAGANTSPHTAHIQPLEHTQPYTLSHTHTATHTHS